MPCSYEHEQHLASSGQWPVAGVDEAGRGPLAGPVVAAAVILPPGLESLGLDDSKKLTLLVRRRLYDILTTHTGVCWSVAVRSPAEIDRLNILRATHEAMREAVLGLEIRARHALIDGLPVHPFPIPQTAVVGGDACSVSVAAASIIAKVTRDRIMDEHAVSYPLYGFERHKGYATVDHLANLRDHGPCEIHRRSFAPVAQLSLDLSI